MDRRYGTELNVYQVGKSMACLILRGREVDRDHAFKAELGPRNMRFRTIGYELLQAPYSVLLRKTVLWCLCYNLANRPEPGRLVAIIDRALQACGDVDSPASPAVSIRSQPVARRS